MGFVFYPIDSRPKVYDVVWSKWPHRGEKLRPGPWVRPVLVLDVRLYEDERDQRKYAAVTAQYGGDFQNHHLPQNLLIESSEYRALGLHKPTLFRLDLGNRLRLPWCEEYFVSQSYIRSQGIIAGSLDPAQQLRLHECLKLRGLAFPLPLGDFNN